MKIWITRSTGGAILSRGLGQVFVWFHEPCLSVDIISEDMFPLDDSDEQILRRKLAGVLYGRNCKYNFIYRNGNDKKSGFGNKLIRNDDGIDFPLILEKYHNEYKLSFTHEVFGAGPKVDYRKNTVGNLFGYDNPVSDKIWEFVVEEFQGDKPLTDEDFYKWPDIEKEKPWWRFCKELEIEINLK